MEFVGAWKEPFAELVNLLGLSGAQSRVSIDGEPPALESPHRIALSGSLALAAQGAAIAALWEQRGGQAQRVSLDPRDTVFAMNPFPWLKRNGRRAHHLERMSLGCNGFFPTRDGRMFYITANYPKLRDGVLKLLDCANDPAAAANAVGRWGGEDLDQAFMRAGLTGTLVRTREEWAAHPHGKLIASRPLVEIERIGDGAPLPLGRAARPLEGVRVADMTHVFAGPSLSRGLAEQGADVLHLGPIRLDLADAPGITLETGIGKRSAIIDFDEGDAATLRSLLGEADVFVQSWRPGLLDARGFSPAQAAALRPGIIYVTISCYGLEGPWAGRAGFDPVALASSGMVDDEAKRDTHKISPPGIVTDGIAGFLGAAAVVATLGRRAREGGSWHVRLSLARMAHWIQALGQYPAATRPGDLGAPRLRRMDSPFGLLEYVAPPLRYSETEAYFARPPEPVGASLPRWLPRNH
ncbi:MAG TPA: CoA transferase [Burkholderiales bacterium]|nr:CoA transferase [Burkholderiales bacterium]